MTQKQTQEIERLQQWVHDLQSGMYINCVYCGHRYGPDDKVAPTMQQALYDHVAKCSKHPLSQAKARIATLKETVWQYRLADIDRARRVALADSGTMGDKLQEAAKAMVALAGTDWFNAYDRCIAALRAALTDSGTLCGAYVEATRVGKWPKCTRMWGHKGKCSVTTHKRPAPSSDVYQADMHSAREAGHRYVDGVLQPDAAPVGEATKRAMAGPEIPHNEAGVPIIPGCDPSSVRCGTCHAPVGALTGLYLTPHEDPEKCPSCDLRIVPEYVGTKLRCTACDFLWETV